jgi:hypothetical protein
MRGWSLAAFLSDETGEAIALPRLNPSPPGELSLDRDAETRLRQKLGRASALHGRLRPDGRLEEREAL